MSWALNEKPCGLMFHHFHGQGHRAAEGSLSREDFEAVLDRFPGILSAVEWAGRARRGALRPGDLCLTFDDSLRSQIAVALPVLRRRGLTAFWFAYSSVCEGEVEKFEVYRYLRTQLFGSFAAFFAAFMETVRKVPGGVDLDAWLDGFDPAAYLPQFRFYNDDERTYRFVRDIVLGPEKYALAMDRMIAEAGLATETLRRRLWLDNDDLVHLHETGHVIGLHSHTHPTQLARLSPERQRQEYARNQAHLTRVLGWPADCVAHPCNSYGSETLGILTELGVTLGFCSSMNAPGGMLEQPREDVGHLMISMGRRAGLSPVFS